MIRAVVAVAAAVGGFGLLAVSAVVAMIVIAVWAPTTQHTKPAQREWSAEDERVVQALLHGNDPRTIDETTTVQAQTGGTTFSRTVTYVAGFATRVDTVGENGRTLHILIHDSLGALSQQSVTTTCQPLIALICEHEDSYNAARAKLDALGPPTPEASPSAGPTVDVRLIRSLPTARVTVSTRLILGEPTTCTLSESPYGDTETCVTGDPVTLYHRRDVAGSITTHRVTKFERSVPDGIFDPPYPVVTPTFTP